MCVLINETACAHQMNVGLPVW